MNLERTAKSSSAGVRLAIRHVGRRPDPVRAAAPSFRADSTNERARSVRPAAPGGLVVTADEQTAGRGGAGAPGSRRPGPACSTRAASPYSGAIAAAAVAVPIAVCEAAEAVAPVRCQVKWPNDVWIEGGRSPEPWRRRARRGLGRGRRRAQRRDPQDDFPAELRETATSLLPTEAERGPRRRRPSVADALAALNESLGRWAGRADDAVLDAYRAESASAAADLMGGRRGNARRSTSVATWSSRRRRRAGRTRRRRGPPRRRA
jgi:biotin-(acetyl-CoA carboxylase) ligase